MDNKALTFVLGVGIFVVFIVGSIVICDGGVAFIHIPSAMIVAGCAGGLGLATYKGGGLIAFIACAKRFCIPAGVIGALIGIVQMLAVLTTPEELGRGMAICLLTLLYGVICYCLADVIVTKAAD